MKAFTLIELLVVISIIGLLASIVLVSLEGGEQRAITGKAMEFSHTVRVSLGADLVGEWKLDETSGTTTKDSSGSDNNGIIAGNPIRVDGVFGKALWLDGLDDYVNIINPASLNITNKITIELWIKPEELNRRQRLVNKGSQYYLNFWETNRIYVHLRRNDGAWFESYISTKVWGANDLNKFSHIVMTWDGSNVKGYINGAYETGFAALASPLTVTGNNVYIGSVGGSEVFKGTIDEVRIYNNALSSSEIQKHYAEGLERHQLVRN